MPGISRTCANDLAAAHKKRSRPWARATPVREEHYYRNGTIDSVPKVISADLLLFDPLSSCDPRHNALTFATFVPPMQLDFDRATGVGLCQSCASPPLAWHT